MFSLLRFNHGSYQPPLLKIPLKGINISLNAHSIPMLVQKHNKHKDLTNMKKLQFIGNSRDVMEISQKQKRSKVSNTVTSQHIKDTEYLKRLGARSGQNLFFCFFLKLPLYFLCDLTSNETKTLSILLFC